MTRTYQDNGKVGEEYKIIDSVANFARERQKIGHCNRELKVRRSVACSKVTTPEPLGIAACLAKTCSP